MCFRSLRINWSAPQMPKYCNETFVKFTWQDSRSTKHLTKCTSSDPLDAEPRLRLVCLLWLASTHCGSEEGCAFVANHPALQPLLLHLHCSCPIVLHYYTSLSLFHCGKQQDKRIACQLDKALARKQLKTRAKSTTTPKQRESQAGSCTSPSCRVQNHLRAFQERQHAVPPM